MTTKRLCERWLDNMFMVLYEVNNFIISIIIITSIISKKKKIIKIIK